MKIKINSNIENVLTSFKVLIIVYKRLSSFFHDLANLNILINLNALIPVRAPLVPYYCFKLNDTIKSIMLVRTTTQSNMLK